MLALRCADDVPSAESLQANHYLTPFVRAATDVRGIYLNADVTCFVYSYTTGDPDAVANIRRAAAAAGWRYLGAGRFVQETFYRAPTGDCGEGGSSDRTVEVRMHHDRWTRRVVLAIVTVSHRHDAGCPEGEDDYANDVLWPQFERAVTSAGSPPSPREARATAASPPPRAAAY